jgi:phosphoribosyl-ATP pyrophosphohydrolase
MADFSLADLAKIIEARAIVANTEASYTARLLAEGVEKCSRKFGEEAIELTIAAVSQDDAAVTWEAADVLYHLMVLLQARGVMLVDVMAALENRTRQSGLDEKAARGAKAP